MSDEIQQLETQLAQAVTNKEKINAMNALARKLRHSDPERSLALNEKAHKLSIQDAYAQGIADSLLASGQTHYQLGQYNLAQSYFMQALLLFEETKDLTAQADVWNGIGLIQWRLADYAESIANHQKALTLFRAAGSKDGEGRALGNLGLVYGVTGAYELAFEMFHQAVEAFQAIGQQKGVGFALNNMALTYLKVNDTDSALDCVQKSLAIARKIGNTTLKMNALDTMGDIYLARNDAEQALVYFRQSIVLADVVGKQHGKLTALLNMGRAYAQKGEDKSALATWQDALDLAKKLDAKDEQRQCYQGMAQLHKQNGNFEQALDCHERFHHLDRMIFNEAADIRLKTLHVAHNMATIKNEAEIAHLQNVTLQQEIAQRAKIERALRESEERLRALIDASPDHIYFKDDQGQWIIANKAGLQLFNLENAPYQGKTDRELAEYAPFFREALFYCAETDEKTWIEGKLSQVNEIVPQMDGTFRTFNVIKAPVFNEDGSRKGLVVLGRDITEQIKSEKLLRQAQKMEGLGVLAGGVAHDFNNLLVAMLGQTSLALDKIRDESPARPHVEKAVNAAKRAADLTQQMLAYSGRGHFEVRPLNLNVLIEENLHLFAASTPKNVSLHSELADSLPRIEADAGQMQQVVMNLIINGAEAIGDAQGRVLVVTGVEDIEEGDGRFQQFTASPLAPGPYVTLEVHDNGAGMDAETTTKIFDPFFSTKQTGHGLGLAAVSGIVRGHNGGIGVYSEVGQGTTFKILLPVSKAHAVDDRRETAVSVASSKASLVLVIDDEAPVREAVADILEMDGIEVIAAANGTDGIALYQERMADIGLVILDLSMPGISGEETFRRLRRINPNVKVLLSSGYSQVEAIRHFSGEGLAGFMQKPYNAATLQQEVKKFL